jgi:hypothetical protein
MNHFGVDNSCFFLASGSATVNLLVVLQAVVDSKATTTVSNYPAAVPDVFGILISCFAFSG